MQRAWLGMLLMVACAGSPPPSEEAVAKPSRVVALEDADAQGPYLAVTVRGVGGAFRFYLPPSDACRALIRDGRARFVRAGPLGSLRGPGSVRCEPIGLGELAAWRDRFPARRSRYLQPRADAHFRPVGESATQVRVRGSFPLALELRWPAARDVVAFLPNLPACRAIARAGDASMEFRPVGSDALVLTLDRARCPIVGLAHPLSLD